MRFLNFFLVVACMLFLLTACNQKVGTKSINSVVEPTTEQLDLAAFARVIYVSIRSENGDGSKGNPFNSIRDAIKAGDSGTAVLVSSGICSTHTLKLKDGIHLFGGFNPTDWSRDIEKHKTYIDGLDQGRLVIAGDNNTIDGFVLAQGKIRGKGAAIFVEGGSIKISNNYFVGNQTLEPEPWNPKYWHETANDGGAIYCQNGATALIENNVFTGNTTVNGRGAAIAVDGKCKPVIRNNVFFENTAGLNDPMRSSDAGALSIFDWSEAVIENNLFISNTADSKNDGGAIFIALWSSARINNNLFVDNHAGDDAGALFVGGQEHRYGGAPLDPLPAKDRFFVSIRENTFIGNHHGGINSGAMRFTMESRGEFVKNRLAQNNGVYFQRSEVRVANNIILDNFLFIETKEGLDKGLIENNLIWADYEQQTDAVVQNNNMLEPVEGDGNYSTAPDFINDGVELKSIASVYHRPKFTTTLFVEKKLKKNELANRAVRAGNKWSVVKSNEDKMITVWGNFSGEVRFDVAPTYTLLD